jgi:hypothetical protein
MFDNVLFFGILFIDVVIGVQSKFQPTFVAITPDSSGKAYDTRGGYCCSADGKLTWKDSFKKVRIDCEVSGGLSDILIGMYVGGSKGESIANPIDIDAEECSVDSNVVEHSACSLKIPSPSRRSNGKNLVMIVQARNAGWCQSASGKGQGSTSAPVLKPLELAGVGKNVGNVVDEDVHLRLCLGPRDGGSLALPTIRSDFWRNCGAKRDYLTLSCGSKDETSSSDSKKSRL